MAADLNKVDPNWAWSPYEPDEKQPWTRAAAAHLYRRAGFGASSRELDEAASQSPDAIVARLSKAGAEAQQLSEQIDDLGRTLLATGDPKNLSAWWLYRMLAMPDQLQEKATLFWHGHFATGAEKVEDAKLMHQQNLLLREHALGSFAPLAHQMSRDPAMLIYLDSATNRKAHPNENYARELMELFCLGEGAYSEKDVQEVARCFTGWEIRRSKYRFNRFQHDVGEKSFLGRTGKFGGEDAVEIVLEQKTAPQFITAKLVRFFMFDEPAPPAELIAPLAEDFRRHDFDIGRLITRILTSRLFFSEHCIGRKVRSPIELAIGLLRSLEGSANTQQLAEELGRLDHALFYPPNVKGWDGGRAWINSQTLVGRTNLVRRLVFDDKTRFAGDDLTSLAKRYNLKSPDETVAWLLDLLLATQVPDEVRNQLVELAGEGGDRNRQLGKVVHAIGSLPEFQLC